MRIVVFSGTTEGRDFSRAAAALGIAVDFLKRVRFINRKQISKLQKDKQ